MSKGLSIPDEIYEKIARRVKSSKFESVDEYVAYVLEQLIEKLEGVKECVDEKGDGEGGVYTRDDEEEIKKRLKSLGYLE